MVIIHRSAMDSTRSGEPAIEEFGESMVVAVLVRPSNAQLGGEELRN